MDISKLTSRKNLVGMILAIVAIVVHLAVGLGPLWPVVALAAWGLGVVVTPSSAEPKALPSRTPLSDASIDSAQQLSALGAGSSPQNTLRRIVATMQELENHMDDLAAEPILLKTVNEIAFNHLPALVPAYRAVPDIARAQGDAQLNSSLELLEGETSKILRAVIDKNLQGLGDQRAFLERQFTDVQLYLEK